MKLCAITILIVAFIGCALSEDIAKTDEEVISLINQLDDEESLPLFGGLSLEKVENSDQVSAPRGSESLTERLIRYVRSHKVNFEISEARSSVGGKTKPVIVKKVKSTLNKIINFSYILINF